MKDTWANNRVYGYDYSDVAKVRSMNEALYKAKEAWEAAEREYLHQCDLLEPGFGRIDGITGSPEAARQAGKRADELKAEYDRIYREQWGPAPDSHLEAQYEERYEQDW